MIRLLSTSDVLRLVTSTDADIDVHAEYADALAGVQDTAIAAVATTTIVSAPSSTPGVPILNRGISAVSIANRDATDPCVVRVQRYDGTTAIDLCSETLYAGDSLAYMHGLGWSTHRTQAAGIAGTTLGNVCNIPIGTVALASIATDVASVAGTIYYSEIFLPANKICTGIGLLNGTTVGTDLVIYGLASSTGALLANTALAGTLSATADVFQQIAFTAPYTAVGPARYFLLLQVNGTTACHQKIAASTFRNFASSVAGVFGTLADITPPTSTVADKGPIGYLY